MTDNNASDFFVEGVTAKRVNVATPRPLNALFVLVLWGMTGFVAVGIYVAIANLPVITGCKFYARCSVAEVTEQPSDLGVSPIE